MNLKLFFKATPIIEGLSQSALGNSIKSLTDDSLDLEQMNLALVGLTEDRGTQVNLGVSEGADRIREHFIA